MLDFRLALSTRYYLHDYGVFLRKILLLTLEFHTTQILNLTNHRCEVEKDLVIAIAATTAIHLRYLNETLSSKTNKRIKDKKIDPKQ